MTLHVEGAEWPLRVVVHDLLGRVVHGQLMDQPTTVLDLNYIESGAVLVTVISQGGMRQSGLLTLSR